MEVRSNLIPPVVYSCSECTVHHMLLVQWMNGQKIAACLSYSAHCTDVF